MSGSCGWFPLRAGEIQAWVRAHSKELPQTLSEISRFPIPFRNAIEAAVAPEVRAALWCEHLKTFLGPTSELTEPQRDLVSDAIAAFPVVFTSPRAEGEVRMRELAERARNLMTRAQAARIFYTLGPPEPPEGLPLPPDAVQIKGTVR